MTIKKNEADATKVQLDKHSHQPTPGPWESICPSEAPRGMVQTFKAEMHLVAGMRRLEGLPET